MRFPKFQFSLSALIVVLVLGPPLIALFALDDWFLWEVSLELCDLSLWAMMLRGVSHRLMENWSMPLVFAAGWLATMAVFEIRPILRWLRNSKNKAP